jgi:hypothetical protein
MTSFLYIVARCINFDVSSEQEMLFEALFRPFMFDTYVFINADEQDIVT